MATRAADIPSGTLFSMRAKLARRIKKLDPTEDTPWLMETRDTINCSEAIIQKRWENVQCRDTKTLPMQKLSEVSFHQDTELKLRNLNRYLSLMRSRSAGNHEAKGPGDLTLFEPLPLSVLPMSDRIGGPSRHAMQVPMLLEFENWVELALPAWLDEQLRPGCHLGNDQAAALVRQVQGLIQPGNLRRIWAQKISFFVRSPKLG